MNFKPVLSVICITLRDKPSEQPEVRPSALKSNRKEMIEKDDLRLEQVALAWARAARVSIAIDETQLATWQNTASTGATRSRLHAENPSFPPIPQRPIMSVMFSSGHVF